MRHKKGRKKKHFEHYQFFNIKVCASTLLLGNTSIKALEQSARHPKKSSFCLWVQACILYRAASSQSFVIEQGSSMIAWGGGLNDLSLSISIATLTHQLKGKEGKQRMCFAELKRG